MLLDCCELCFELIHGWLLLIAPRESLAEPARLARQVARARRVDRLAGLHRQVAVPAEVFQEASALESRPAAEPPRVLAVPLRPAELHLEQVLRPVDPAARRRPPHHLQQLPLPPQLSPPPPASSFRFQRFAR